MKIRNKKNGSAAKNPGIKAKFWFHSKEPKKAQHS